LPKVRIEITNTGAGISEVDQERVFERFYRVENAVHTEVGTGLGLSIVRGILEKHGCTVQAERSRYQGERVLVAQEQSTTSH
jgi:two-component system sensor histidine kinase NblS